MGRSNLLDCGDTEEGIGGKVELRTPAPNRRVIVVVVALGSVYDDDDNYEMCLTYLVVIEFSYLPTFFHMSDWKVHTLNKKIR